MKIRVLFCSAHIRWLNLRICYNYPVVVEFLAPWILVRVRTMNDVHESSVPWEKWTKMYSMNSTLWAKWIGYRFSSTLSSSFTVLFSYFPRFWDQRFESPGESCVPWEKLTKMYSMNWTLWAKWISYPFPSALSSSFTVLLFLWILGSAFRVTWWVVCSLRKINEDVQHEFNSVGQVDWLPPFLSFIQSFHSSLLLFLWILGSTFEPPGLWSSSSSSTSSVPWFIIRLSCVTVL